MIDEVEFINKISTYLDNFSQKGHGKYNFSCPLCGDGKTGYKTRAWFLERDSYYFHCFNCSAQMSLSNFLKLKFPDVYNEYVFAKLSKNKKNQEIVFKEKEDIDLTTHNYIKSLLKPLNEEALKYLKGRKIPEKHFKDIYIIENFQDLNKVEKYKETKFLKESRIVIPLYNDKGVIIGIISRAISADLKKRYINLKFYDESVVYNLYDKHGNFKINLNKTLYIVEGAFDSLFLDNAIAVNTSDLLMVKRVLNTRLLNNLSIVYVPDNDKRNKEIINIYNKIISAGEKIVIMPDYIKGKDINEIILKNNVNIVELLKENTFKDLSAHLRVVSWRKM
jgi:DNA primase